MEQSLKKMLLVDPQILESFIQRNKHVEKKRSRIVRAVKSRKKIPIDQKWYQMRRLLNEYMMSKDRAKIIPQKNVMYKPEVPPESFVTSTPKQIIKPIKKSILNKLNPSPLSQFEATPTKTNKYNYIHLMRKLPTKDSPATLLVQKEGENPEVLLGDEADSYYEDGDGLSFINPLHERNILFDENVSAIPKSYSESEEEDEGNPYMRKRSGSDASTLPRLRPKTKLIEPMRWEHVVKH